MADIPTNMGEVAWGHWLAQFEDSPKLKSFVRALYKGMDMGARAASELYLNRWLDTAVGKQLDGIGEIVGQARQVLAGSVPFFGFFGQSNSGGFGQARFRREPETDISGIVALADQEYRHALRWKIAVNRGTGTARDIADAVNAVFDTTGARVKWLGNAKIQIIVDVHIDANNPLIVNREQWVPAAAGIHSEFVGFRETLGLLTESGDRLTTEDGDTFVADVFDRGQ